MMHVRKEILKPIVGIVADAYIERSSYTEGPDNEPRSYRFVNATTDSWRDGSDITLGYTYDGFGRMKEAVSTDGSLAESLTADLDATVTDVVRRYNNAVVQDAHIDIDGALPTGVRDESSPHYQDAVGRFAPGTYTMTYDVNGRLTADGMRGVTSVTYHPWLNLPQTIKFGSGDWAKSDYWPDGTLRSRFTQTRRIDPISVVKNSELYPIGVIPDSTATIDPAAIVNPTLRTTRRYRGSFEIVSGSESYARVNTSTGYYDCKEKRHYYYLTNRQGSVMAVIDDQGTTVQRTGLYPSGTPFILPSDIRLIPAKNTTPTLTPATDRLHIGNRWLGHSGLNRYDNTARLHDPLLCRFDTPDPLATENSSCSIYSHCNANPANFIDIEGEKPRLYVETKGFGHVFLSTGQNGNLKVYTYGRYGNTNPSSSGPSVTGDGILIKLTGVQAQNYIDYENNRYNIHIFEFEKNADSLIDKYFEDKIIKAQEDGSQYKNNTKVLPGETVPAIKIDEYNLFRIIVQLHH